MNFEIAPKSAEIKSNWYEANLYCMFLEVDEKKGWRLPTLEELNVIYDCKNDFIGSLYWSSTEYNDIGACVQDMSYVTIDWAHKYNHHHCPKHLIRFVRAVRSL